ncbi:MAG: hypothetical protein E7265_04865 [Lachnospiraceae bacterium]|nr:hypothetical protein [Lachnospiraceae bacterium]
MEDRYEEIFEQYSFEVYGKSRVRGGSLLDTDDGCKIIKETGTSAGRLMWEHMIKSRLVKEGFKHVDSFCLNKDGNISSIASNGIRYVIRDWYTGNECNIRDKNEIRLAAENMAAMHDCLKCVETNEGTTYAGGQDVIASFRKHNAELRHIRKYLKGRKEKNRYELELLKAFPEYCDNAEKVLAWLEGSNLQGMWAGAVAGKDVMHGSYTYHNIIMCDNYVATTVFEKCSYGLQLMDLYYFLRKVMEKNEWDGEYGNAVLIGYRSVIELSEEERRVLAMLLLYPEKFWKLASCYMNSKKTWISAKNMEKLNMLCIQKENREKFVKSELLKESLNFDIM